MKLNLFILVLLLTFDPAYSQNLLKKAKEKMNTGSKILRDITGNEAKEEERSSNEAGDYGMDDYANRSGRPSNTKGKKLSPNSIDVAQEIKNAENNLSKNDYKHSRNSIQQAILGLEVALAYKILESLPTEVTGLKAFADTDNVSASGAGYTGLTINREYIADNLNKAEDNNDEEQRFLEFSLVNSSLYVSGITAYIANPVYSSSDSGDKKIIQYNNTNCLLEYNDYEGYKLSVPAGQNTLVQFKCINFEDENEVLAAANSFDINKIKNYLGEK